jgi:hypothetical protein
MRSPCCLSLYLYASVYRSVSALLSVQRPLIFEAYEITLPSVYIPPSSFFVKMLMRSARCLCVYPIFFFFF